jgi:hypothetical protein
VIPELEHRCEALRTAVNAVTDLAPGERWMLKGLASDLMLELRWVCDDPVAAAWWRAAALVRAALGPCVAPDKVWARAVAAMPPMAGGPAVSVPDDPGRLDGAVSPRFVEVHDPVLIAENERLIGLESD